MAFVFIYTIDWFTKPHIDQTIKGYFYPNRQTIYHIRQTSLQMYIFRMYNRLIYLAANRSVYGGAFLPITVYQSTEGYFPYKRQNDLPNCPQKSLWRGIFNNDGRPVYGGVFLPFTVDQSMDVLMKNAHPQTGIPYMVKIPLHRLVYGWLCEPVYRVYGKHPSVDWSTINGRNTPLQTGLWLALQTSLSCIWKTPFRRLVYREW